MGKKNRVSIGFGHICGFRSLLGVLIYRADERGLLFPFLSVRVVNDALVYTGTSRKEGEGGLNLEAEQPNCPASS